MPGEGGNVGQENPIIGGSRIDRVGYNLNPPESQFVAAHNMREASPAMGGENRPKTYAEWKADLSSSDAGTRLAAENKLKELRNLAETLHIPEMIRAEQNNNPTLSPIEAEGVAAKALIEHLGKAKDQSARNELTLKAASLQGLGRDMIEHPEDWKPGEVETPPTPPTSPPQEPSREPPAPPTPAPPERHEDNSLREAAIRAGEIAVPLIIDEAVDRRREREEEERRNSQNDQPRNTGNIAAGRGGRGREGDGGRETPQEPEEDPSWDGSNWRNVSGRLKVLDASGMNLAQEEAQSLMAEKLLIVDAATNDGVLTDVMDAVNQRIASLVVRGRTPGNVNPDEIEETWQQLNSIVVDTNYQAIFQTNLGRFDDVNRRRRYEQTYGGMYQAYIRTVELAISVAEGAARAKYGLLNKEGQEQLAKDQRSLDITGIGDIPGGLKRLADMYVKSEKDKAPPPPPPGTNPHTPEGYQVQEINEPRRNRVFDQRFLEKYGLASHFTVIQSQSATIYNIDTLTVLDALYNNTDPGYYADFLKTAQFKTASEEEWNTNPDNIGVFIWGMLPLVQFRSKNSGTFKSLADPETGQGTVKTLRLSLRGIATAIQGDEELKRCLAILLSVNGETFEDNPKNRDVMINIRGMSEDDQKFVREQRDNFQEMATANQLTFPHNYIRFARVENQGEVETESIREQYRNFARGVGQHVGTDRATAEMAAHIATLINGGPDIAESRKIRAKYAHLVTFDEEETMGWPFLSRIFFQMEPVLDENGDPKLKNGEPITKKVSLLDILQNSGMDGLLHAMQNMTPDPTDNGLDQRYLQAITGASTVLSILDTYSLLKEGKGSGYYAKDAAVLYEDIQKAVLKAMGMEVPLLTPKTAQHILTLASENLPSAGAGTSTPEAQKAAKKRHDKEMDREMTRQMLPLPLANLINRWKDKRDADIARKKEKKERRKR